MDRFNAVMRITKMDAAKRLVFGTITEEIVDKAHEVLDYATSKPLFEEWSQAFKDATGGKSHGNLRAMHGKVAAGKFLSLDFDDETKKISGCAHVVDDAEWDKCEHGVYTGFSLGGEYVKRWTDEKDPNIKRYTGKPAEVSLVDNPCVPTATFDFIRADGASELRKFKVQPQNDAELSQVWLCKADGSTHATKELAKKHGDKLAADARAAALGKEATDALAELTTAVNAVDGDPAADLAALNAALGKLDPADKAYFTAEGVAKGLNMPVEDFLAIDDEDQLKAIKKWVGPDWADIAKLGSGEPAKKTTTFRENVGAEDDGAEGKLALAKKAALAKGKTLVTNGVEKGLYMVGCVADVLARIDSYKQSVEFEQAIEGDADSGLVAQFDEWIKQGALLLVAMVNEETAEMIEGVDIEVIEAFASPVAVKVMTEALEAATKVEGADGEKIAKALDVVTKAGAKHSANDKKNLQTAHDALKAAGAGCAGIDKAGKRHSAADLERLNTAHDLVTKVGADCPMDKAVIDANLTKAFGGAAAPSPDTEAVAVIEGAFTKFAGELTTSIKGLVKRMSDMEKRAAPAKGVRRVIEKVNDGGGTGDQPAPKLVGKALQDEVQRLLSAVPPEQRGDLLMRISLSNGQVIA